MVKETFLPDLLKDKKHFQLFIKVCKDLSSLRSYWEALEIINNSLKLSHNHLSIEKQDELWSLGAQLHIILQTLNTAMTMHVTLFDNTNIALVPKTATIKYFSIGESGW